LGWGRTSNAADGAGAGRAVADGVAVRGELPEAIAVVDVGVGQRPGELGLVDEAEVVRAGRVILQADGEERGVQLGLDGVEEGGLRLGLDCSR
jgi:hypothetical protein